MFQKWRQKDVNQITKISSTLIPCNLVFVESMALAVGKKLCHEWKPIFWHMVYDSRLPNTLIREWKMEFSLSDMWLTSSYICYSCHNWRRNKFWFLDASFQSSTTFPTYSYFLLPSLFLQRITVFFFLNFSVSAKVHRSCTFYSNTIDSSWRYFGVFQSTIWIVQKYIILFLTLYSY